MIQTLMRKILCRMTKSSYYASWKHSHSTLAHYTPLDIIDVFSLNSVSFTTAAIQLIVPNPPTPFPQGLSHGLPQLVWCKHHVKFGCAADFSGDHVISMIFEASGTQPVPKRRRHRQIGSASTMDRRDYIKSVLNKAWLVFEQFDLRVCVHTVAFI